MKEVSNMLILISTIWLISVMFPYTLYFYVLSGIGDEALRGLVSLLLGGILLGVMIRLGSMVYEKFLKKDKK